MFFQRITAFFAALITLLTGLFGMTQESKKVEDFRVKSYVIGEYIQDINSLHSEDFDIITDVILFGSATFDAEGNVIVQKEELETALYNLRTVIGERDIKITLNLLGPGGYTDSPVWEDQMEAQTVEHNKAFTSGVLEDNIIAVLDEYGFDGVHFDYEYPITLNAWYYFNNFLVSLDKKLGDYTLGVATNEWNLKFSTAALKAVDSLELMMYDIYDDEGKHSTYETATTLARKVGLSGVPLEKVTFGLPFYARPSDHYAYWYEYATYSDKLDENGWYHCDNVNRDFWFNTPDVIYAKTEFAINSGYGGVMIWNYTCDLPSSDDLSLLGAIGDAVGTYY